MAPVRPFSPQDSPMQSAMSNAEDGKEDIAKEETVSISSSDGPHHHQHFSLPALPSSSSPQFPSSSSLPSDSSPQDPPLTRISFSLKNRGPSSASVLPQPQTDSARDARRAFFCELCQKGYARSTDFEAHEGSYDHQHRKRLKEMRAMTKDPSAAQKQRLAESRSASGLKSVSIPLSSTNQPQTASGKKKPVFKSTLQPQNVAAVSSQPGGIGLVVGTGSMTTAAANLAANEVMLNDWNLAGANGWADDVYDPLADDGDDGDEDYDVDLGELVREFKEVDEKREREKRDRMEQ